MEMDTTDTKIRRSTDGSLKWSVMKAGYLYTPARHELSLLLWGTITFTTHNYLSV
jgi:hypothetical protein